MLLALALGCVDATATTEERIADAVEVVVGDPTTAHAGYYRTVEGAVWCWGGSNLALNFVGPQPGPWKVRLPKPAVKLATGRVGHCAVLVDGDVACWRGFNGQAAGARVGVKDAVDLGVGDERACVATKKGRVVCWSTFESTPKPVETPGIEDAVSVALSGGSICALRADNSLRCWASTPHTLSSGERGPMETGVRRVAMGYGQMCVERTDGVVRCRTEGQEQDIPLGDAPVTGLATGWGWGCAVQEGVVRCWGRGPSPMVTDRPIPTREPRVVEGLEDAVGVSVFARYACASTRSGAVRCWGYNTLGELGDGTTVDSPDAATWLVRYAPTMLPEPKGGVFGCTAGEDARRSCLAAGPDCRLVPPPDAWYLPPSGIDRSGDEEYERQVIALLSQEEVPRCMCSCDAAYLEAQRAFQEKMARECCPP